MSTVSSEDAKWPTLDNCNQTERMRERGHGRTCPSEAASCQLEYYIVILCPTEWTGWGGNGYLVQRTDRHLNQECVN